jgi:hypothetical protein
MAVSETVDAPKPLEVKQGWSTSYIVLTIFLSILTGCGGYILKYFLESPPRQVITISTSNSGNLLNLDRELQKRVVTKFEMLKNPDLMVESFFRYNVKFRNSGELGIDSLHVTIEANDASITIVKPPNISGSPPNILKAMELKNDTIAQPSYRDQWIIPLLNPGESINFEYLLYSENKTDSCNIAAIARKKDLISQYGVNNETNPKEYFVNKKLGDLNGRDVLYYIMMVSFMQTYIIVIIIVVFNRFAIRRLLDNLIDKHRRFTH